jgi:hypothetical protein
MKYKNDRNNIWQPNKQKHDIIISKMRYWNKKYNYLQIKIDDGYDISFRSLLKILNKNFGDDFKYIETILKSENIELMVLKDLYLKWVLDCSIDDVLSDMRDTVKDFNIKYRNLKLKDLCYEN